MDVTVASRRREGTGGTSRSGLGLRWVGMAHLVAPPQESVADLSDRAEEPRPVVGALAVAWPGLLVGGVAAVVGLGRDSLWRDEAYSLGAVNQLGPTLRGTGGTMGLYYALLTAWTQVSQSVWWTRALSVLLAVAAIALLAPLAQRLLGTTTARRACVFLALSTIWVNYAQEARSYALVLLLTVASWSALDRALSDDEGGRRRWWWAHTAIAALLPLAHGLAILQLLAQAVALLVGRADARTWKGYVRSVAVAVVVTLALLQAGASEVGTWIQPIDRAQVSANIAAFTSDVPVLMVLLLVTMGLGAARAVRAAQRATEGPARTRALIPVVWAVVPPLLLLVLSVVRPSLVPRYVIGSAPGFALLLASGTGWVDRRLAARVSLPVVTTLVLVSLVLGQVRLHGSAGDDWRAAARTVATRAEPGDAILLAEGAVRPAFEAAWRDVDAPPDLPLVNGTRPIGEVLRVEPLLPDEVAWSRARTRGRVWLVNEGRSSQLEEAERVLTAPDTGAPTHRVAGSWNEDTGVTATLLVPL